jgi:hypothetical protein
MVRDLLSRQLPLLLRSCSTHPSVREPPWKTIRAGSAERVTSVEGQAVDVAVPVDDPKRHGLRVIGGA